MDDEQLRRQILAVLQFSSEKDLRENRAGRISPAQERERKLYGVAGLIFAAMFGWGTWVCAEDGSILFTAICGGLALLSLVAGIRHILRREGAVSFVDGEARFAELRLGHLVNWTMTIGDLEFRNAQGLRSLEGCQLRVYYVGKSKLVLSAEPLPSSSKPSTSAATPI